MHRAYSARTAPASTGCVRKPSFRTFGASRSCHHAEFRAFGASGAGRTRVRLTMDGVSIEALRELAAVVGDQHVVSDALEPFRHDATFMDGELIGAVLPGTTAEVSAVMKVCSERGIPVVARGGGSSLVGGSVPLGGGIVLSLERMDGIEIDAGNVCAVAGAGAITGRIQEEAALHGLMYPPDPASAQMSSIGAHVASTSAA